MKYLRDHKELLFEDWEEGEWGKDDHPLSVDDPEPRGSMKIVKQADKSTDTQTLEYNISFLSSEQLYIIPHRGGGAGDRRKLFIDELKKIPTLSQSKIKKKLGKGIQKSGFLLQNGHVFVIATRYLKGLDDDGMGDPIKTLKSISARMHSGKGSKHDFMVYDVARDTHDGKLFWWAELSEIIPMGIYYDIFDIPGAAYELETFAATLKRALKDIMSVARGLPKDQYGFSRPAHGTPTKEQVLEAWRTQEVKEKLASLAKQGNPKSLLIGYAQAIMHVAMTHGLAHVTDFHIMNVGVSVTNPKHVIFFDIT